jgi:outer membrane protein TolC
MTQFAVIAERKYAVGQVSQPDVLRAQVELARLANRFTTETLKLEEVSAVLNGLLSRSPEAPLGVPHQEPSVVVAPHSFADLTERMLRNRPELAAQSAVIARDAAALALAQKAYLPDFEVGIERFFNFNRKDGVGFMVSTTIPLAYRDKYDASVAEARARLNAGKAHLRAIQDQACAEVKRALVRLQTAAELVNLFTATHIPLAEQALASARISYLTGGVDFLSLIDSLRTVEQAHLEHITAGANFQKAYAELERAVGQALPRR